MTGNWRPSGLVSQKGEAKQVPKTKGAQPDLRRQEPDSDQRRAGWQNAGQAWNLPGMRSAFSQQWYSNCVHLKNCVSDMPGVVSDLNLQIPCPAKMSLFLHSMWWVKTSKQGSKQTDNPCSCKGLILLRPPSWSTMQQAANCLLLADLTHFSAMDYGL